jgi:hypothetical protein
MKRETVKLRILRAVEALKASGLTGGDRVRLQDPLNRRRMAIFLAKALDLYWPGASRPY